MKKVLSIILTLAMLLAFTACGDGNVTQTTTDSSTTVDSSVARVQEILTCYKIVITTYLGGEDTVMLNESPDSKESLNKLFTKFVGTLKMYDSLGFHMCIEWRGEENADLISTIEDGFSVKGYACIQKGTTGFSFKLSFNMENSELSQSEYCAQIAELLYYIAENDDVKKVVVSDVCTNFPNFDI